MIPKINCSKGGGEISSADTFCSSCGSRIEWNNSGSQAISPEQKKITKVNTSTDSCPLCGHQNVANRSTCESCGALLQSSQPSSSSAGSKTQQSDRLTKFFPISFFQSGKFTALIGIILVGLVIVFSTTKKGETPAVPEPVNRSD